MSDLHRKVARKELDDIDALFAALRAGMLEILEPCEQPLVIPDGVRPFMILVVGVNGTGKTTTIGKLARRFRDEGRKVMLAAGDTFRAAAIEQLKVWGERNGVPVIAQASGADPAAVVYDAYDAARARGIDVLIADTAGRLHTQGALMEELKKIKRVVRKLDECAPHETLLVLDARHGTERDRTGRAVPRRARPHGARHHEARRHGEGRRRARDRAAHAAARSATSASASRPRTSACSTPASSSPRCWRRRTRPRDPARRR